MALVVSGLIFEWQSATVFRQPAFEDGGLDATADGDEWPDDGVRAIDWDFWKAINPDVVGWVYVPGTGIDYPIVQASASDPRFYLTHDVYRNRNQFGVPYIDAGCSVDAMAVIVYGHNMSFDANAMFGILTKYSDRDFFSSHPSVVLITPDKTRELSVRAAEVTGGAVASRQTGIDTGADLAAWYRSHLDAASVVSEENDDAAPAQVFVFVTCSYNFSRDERTLVFAVDYTSEDGLGTGSIIRGEKDADER
jgi:sortase B